MDERKIPNGTGAAMIATAAFCDVVNLGVSAVSFGMLDFIMDSAEMMVFSVWFSHHNASLWKKNPGLTAAAAVLDAVPMGDLAFPWTLRVTYGVVTEREPAANGASVAIASEQSEDDRQYEYDFSPYMENEASDAAANDEEEDEYAEAE